LHAQYASKGYDIRYKMLCSSGTPTVTTVALANSNPNFSQLTSELSSKGYNKSNVKYWVYLDGRGGSDFTNVCGGNSNCYFGLGSGYWGGTGDDALSATNPNNGGGIPSFAVLFGIPLTGSWLPAPGFFAHESGHTMGAVQRSAPDSDGGAHCNQTEASSIMCTGDSSKTLHCTSIHYDCLARDYFNPAPTSTNYLASHWNIGSKLNHFLSIKAPVPIAWHGWHRVSPNQLLHSAPAVASWGTGRYDLFECVDGSVYHLYYQSGWSSSWESLGGSCVGDPAAVSWGSNRIDVFTRGADNTLQHKWWNGSWSGWQSLGGGVITGSPGVTSTASNRLDVFAVGTSNVAYHMSWNGTAWSPWSSLGGSVQGGFAAVARGTTINIFARGTDNTLKTNGYNGSWVGWSSLGGTLIGSPAADARDSTQINVFAQGTDNQLHTIYYTSSKGWSGWGPMAMPSGTTATSAPGVGDWGSSHIDLYVQGSDNYIWQDSWY
jgi:hypothetical protein